VGFRSKYHDFADPTIKTDLLQTSQGRRIAPPPGPWYNQRPGNLNQDPAGAPPWGRDPDLVHGRK